jgi:hypothetical protein
MADLTVKQSDLTGELVLDPAQVVTIKVLRHPALPDGPVTIEAAAGELKPVEKHQLDVAIFDVTMPGEETGRVVMTVANFDALAKNKPMADVLAAGVPVKQTTRSTGTSKAGGDRLNYATLEHCGELHRGKITDEEARLVRENPEQASSNRQAQGHAAIKWGDPKEQARYGL